MYVCMKVYVTHFAGAAAGASLLLGSLCLAGRLLRPWVPRLSFIVGANKLEDEYVRISTVRTSIFVTVKTGVLELRNKY